MAVSGRQVSSHTDPIASSQKLPRSALYSQPAVTLKVPKPSQKALALHPNRLRPQRQSQQIIMPEPRHEDPASSPKSTQETPQRKQKQPGHQQSNPLLRWTPVTLPPPVFLVPLLLLLLAAFYLLLPSSPPSQVQQSCQSPQHLPSVQASHNPLSPTPPEPVAMASTEQT